MEKQLYVLQLRLFARQGVIRGPMEAWIDGSIMGPLLHRVELSPHASFFTDHLSSLSASGTVERGP